MFHLFSEQLCELVEEEDLELVTALVQWDFEDEMEDEDDEHGMLFVSKSNQGSTGHQYRTARSVPTVLFPGSLVKMPYLKWIL